MAPSSSAPPPGATHAPGGSVRKRTAAPPPSHSERRYRSIAEIMREAKPSSDVTDDYYGGLRCEQCRSGERDEAMLLCDRCDKGYHMYCLRPIVVRVPTGPWFCPLCDDQRRDDRRFPLTQTKIVDFFRIKKSSSLVGEGGEKCGPILDVKKQRRRKSLVLSKKRRRLLPFIPTEDPARRLEQLASLAAALTALHMEFSNDLTYRRGMAPRCANRANLETEGMQVLSKEDREALERCTEMVKRGECPPLIVVFDSLEGYTVEADSHIKDLTIIAEYVGDVDYLSNREHDDCDSLMTLLLAPDPSHSLVICPDKRGNIARFINGINNHCPEARKKQNLKCVRYNVDGECRVLLVACRDIVKGERLYYDYNGYEQEYPTHHFV